MDQTRVLVTTYFSAFFQPGGGEAELLDLASNLTRFDLHVDIYGPTSAPLSSYDSVLHFSVHADGLQIVEKAKSLKKQVILWPNLWWNTSPSDDQKSVTERFFNLADKITFKSHAELENVSRHVHVDMKKIIIVPWGVEPSYALPADPTLFKTMYQLDSYILWLGIIEEQKNQLPAIHALKEIKTPVVFIGHHRNQAYFEACLEAAPKHFKFLPFMPPGSPMLRSAVQNCDLYLEVPFDPPGLSALEAGLAGRTLVLSQGSWTTEEFGDKAICVNPANPAEIFAGVERGLIAKSETNELAEWIRRKHVLPQCLQPLVDLFPKS